MMHLLGLLVVLVITAAVLWRRGSRAYALVAGLLAVFPGLTLLRQLPWWAYLLAALVAAAVGWHHLSRSAALVTRWSGRSSRKAGVASTLDILRHASARAMRKRAATVRPSLAELGRWARWRLPVVDVAIELCRSGWVRVWSSVEDVVMVFGGPRSGKTGWLAGRVLDSPGAVLVTSTRTDLYELCARVDLALAFRARGDSTESRLHAQRAADLAGRTGSERQRRRIAGLLSA